MYMAWAENISFSVFQRLDTKQINVLVANRNHVTIIYKYRPCCGCQHNVTIVYKYIPYCCSQH